MKKILVVGLIALAVVVSLGAVSVAYAQSGTPVCPFCGASGWGGYGGFRGQGQEGTYGPLHEYMITALAEAFGLTPEELTAAHAEGKTLWAIAQEQGKTFDEFKTLMLEARAKALEAAVADGVISQEQADWMLDRMGGQFGGYGLGRMGAGGGCSAYRGALPNDLAPRMRGGWRWNNQP